MYIVEYDFIGENYMMRFESLKAVRVHFKEIWNSRYNRNQYKIYITSIKKDGVKKDIKYHIFRNTWKVGFYKLGGKSVS